MMKQKLLKTIVLGLMFVGGVNMAWGQSTYSYNASNWSNADKGSISVSGGTISVTDVTNTNLVDIKNTTSFKIPYRQTYVIITGTNFYVPTSIETDPCVYLENDKDNKKVNAKVLPTSSKIIVDISGKLPTETDFFGNVTIKQMNIIIKGSTSTTITNIEIYQPDIIDECGSANIGIRNNASATETKGNGFTYTTTDNKAKLTFTPAGNSQEYRFYFYPTLYKFNSSNTYVVIETDANAGISGTRKLESYKVNETNYAGSSSNVNHIGIALSNGHQLIICNPLYSFDSYQTIFLNNETLSCTELKVILKSSGTDALNIYRVGMYNLRELQDLYTDLKNYKFTIDAAFEAKAVSNTSLQRTVVINTTNVPSETMQLEIRSLGNFDVVNGSNKPEIDLRNATITSGSPALIDIPSQFTTDGIFFLLSAANYTYFPTLVNKAKIKDATYANYYDGNITPYSNKMGSTSTYYYAHNRKFVEGYSSCCLPFAIKTTELPSNLEAYTFASCTAEGAVTFAKADGAIAANTPMIIHASEAGYYLIPASATGTAAIATPESYYATEASNGVCFVGSFVNEVPTGDYASTKNYGVTSDGKKLAKMGTSTKTTYYRAFLASSNANFARDLSLGFDDGSGTTEIVSLKDVHGMEPVADGAIYNLQGVRMQGDNLPRGIYVKNGKKFVVK